LLVLIFLLWVEGIVHIRIFDFDDPEVGVPVPCALSVGVGVGFCNCFFICGVDPLQITIQIALLEYEMMVKVRRF